MPGTPPPRVPADTGTARSRSAAPALADMSSAALTGATRRVANRWRDEVLQEGFAAADAETVAGILAALAIAIEQRTPHYVTQLVPRPAPTVVHRLVDMLRTELLRSWSETTGSIAPATILGTLNALEDVRQALVNTAAEELGTRFSGVDGLELLVEVIHDLRSPLTSILFLAETLQRAQSGEVNAVQHRQLGLIYSAALGLSALVSDAIELARGGDELADRDLSPFSVTELMESVRAIVRPMAEEKGLEIRLTPPAVDHRLGFPMALSRVLLNLTTNALKFTERGFVEIVCEERGPSRVAVSVRDTGPGVNPEALTSLFQPFRRPRGRSAYCFSGTGLGLAITRKLVEAMHSALRLETRPNWGTRFFFELELPPFHAGPSTRPSLPPHAA